MKRVALLYHLNFLKIPKDFQLLIIFNQGTYSKINLKSVSHPIHATQKHAFIK